MKTLKNITRKGLLYTGLISSICFAGISCETKTEEAEVEKKKTVVDTSQIDQITLNQQQYSSIGIRLGQVKTETVSDEVKANGIVELPPENQATLSLPVSGKISYMKGIPGQAVQKGELLATLESFEFIQLQQDYLQNASQFTYQEKELERQRTLSTENVGARKNFELAQANQRSTKALLQSLEAKLKILGLSVATLNTKGITPAVRIVSSVNGYITAADVNLGKEVAAGQPIFEVADKSDMHISLTVFEQDASKIKKDQVVIVQLNDGSKPVQAYVLMVGKVLEGETRTLNVHAHINDRKQEAKLVPGAYVNAKIQTGNRPAIMVPAAAIVRKGATGFIYIEEKSKEFHRIPVQIGSASKEDLVEIIIDKNLDGQQLVVKGAYLIDAEFAKRSEPSAE
ncbi:efflux RND transporter periplasmic adaptor subunit [Dyadobacter frigoris]|uniref:Efflux RND transporter periplasmic adaptor subunit n=1 Tax=Dyadobacter frigoris TaxID=2576211 RepID=A0A4V6BIQ4_9BACT|nr:efflux RND transporter periplasmic adaptor subunit [Dyadobacter frigoris]TKT90983.1 efflux RND transporter periplasmic adaptor subunit [Dyadobacter frigoris]GLU56171.1 hemolysin D [Dyadobacter frigoris]